MIKQYQSTAVMHATLAQGLAAAGMQTRNYAGTHNIMLHRSYNPTIDYL